MRSNAIVHSIIYDETKGKATGVRVIDATTKQIIEFFAKVIFVNAGAVNTNLILLNSTSNRFAAGLVNDNDLMGKYFAFHNYRASITARFEGMLHSKTEGGRPTGAYIPRFRNVYKQETDFLRGYATTFSSGRDRQGVNTDGLNGDELKRVLLDTTAQLGPWYVGSQCMGETIPKETNYVKLDTTKKDEWGMPLINFSVTYDDNDEKMIKDFMEQFTDMYESAGFTDIKTHDSKQAPGLDIHEISGVRMGKDPASPLLNEWNQLHACNNVFVTDGACMTSTSTQNPSLTFMALTARAANYAIG